MQNTETKASSQADGNRRGQRENLKRCLRRPTASRSLSSTCCVSSWAKVTADRRPEHANKISLAGTLGDVTIIIGQPVTVLRCATVPDTHLLPTRSGKGQPDALFESVKRCLSPAAVSTCRRSSFCACARRQVLKTSDAQPDNGL